ncbi:MAG: hypothetical protein ABIW50_00855 [Candidatus Limnocylindria bacterium]
MDDLADRYARLVAHWDARVVQPADRVWVASEARAVAAQTDSTWYRVQSLALAAAADAMDGLPLDVRVLLDAGPPPPDKSALARLSDRLPGDGPVAARLAAHREATTVPPERVGSVAEALLALLQRRAADDLDLPAAIPPLTVVVATDNDRTRRARLERGGRAHRLVLDGRRRWTIGSLTRAVVAAGVPGGHLVDALRPTMPVWSPSPQTTVDHGMHAVAREVLLGDHEFAYELTRIGRGNGLLLSGPSVVEVERALDELAPSFASVAMSGRSHASALTELGVDEERARALLTRWRDPLARAECMARAAGPPIVRAWLVRVGQTSGLGRLMREWIVPSELGGTPAGV